VAQCRLAGMAKAGSIDLRIDLRLDARIEEYRKIVSKSASRYKDLIDEGKDLQGKKVDIEKKIITNGEEQAAQLRKLESEKATLAVMIDILCGILSGSGIARNDLPRGSNGVWLHLLEIERFLPRSEYNSWMEKYVTYLKDCRLMPGCTEILLPGEIELRRRKQREEAGVPIPDETWRLINETAQRLGVTVAV
jgi:LDH2 family malate/lactate/ureidoglycolate dehydrogenase